jgi:hypothetical protein
MTSPQPDEMRELLEKQKILEVLTRYCRGVDRVDRNLIAACFHPDGRCEFGALVLEGDKIAATISEAAGGCHITTHMVGNHLVEIHGDVALSELYYLSSAVVKGSRDGERQIRMRAGRYVDRLERRDGRWKIKDRVVVEDWCKFHELPDLPPGVSFRAGQQGRGDPLYTLLNSVKRSD